MPKKKNVPKSVYRHPDVLGAGAKKRKRLNAKQTYEAIIHEFKRGTLRSGSGEHVTNPAQARAIGKSEASKKKEGKKMPVKIKNVDGFRVSTPKGIKAKRTTKKKAKAQERLLNAVEHNPNFVPTGKKPKATKVAAKVKKIKRSESMKAFVARRNKETKKKW